MNTPRLAPNTDYVADDNAAPFLTHTDPGDERPAADATLPSRLLGPTGDVEAAVQRGMATVRRLLDDPDYARLAQKREAAEARAEAAEARVAALEAELLPLLDLDECQPVRDMEGNVMLTPVQAVRALGDFCRETADEVQRLGARVQELEAERARLRAALEPIAAFAPHADKWEMPDDSLFVSAHDYGEVASFTAGHARAARAALAGEEGR